MSTVVAGLVVVVVLVACVVRVVRAGGVVPAFDDATDVLRRIFPSLPIPQRRLPKRLFAEAKRTITVGVSGMTLLPSKIEIYVNPDDLESFGEALGWLVTDLQAGLSAEAERRGWVQLGPVEVVLIPDEQRPLRSPKAVGRFLRTLAVDPSRPAEKDELPATEVLRTRTAELTQEGAVVRLIGTEDINLILGPGDVLTLGRSSSAGVSIADPKVSAQHCQISYDGAAVRIRDLGSTNGTLVNGERVNEAQLSTDDRLQLGSTHYLVDIDEP